MGLNGSKGAAGGVIPASGITRRGAKRYDLEEPECDVQLTLLQLLWSHSGKGEQNGHERSVGKGPLHTVMGLPEKLCTL